MRIYLAGVGLNNAKVKECAEKNGWEFTRMVSYFFGGEMKKCLELKKNDSATLFRTQRQLCEIYCTETDSCAFFLNECESEKWCAECGDKEGCGLKLTYDDCISIGRKNEAE